MESSKKEMKRWTKFLNEWEDFMESKKNNKKLRKIVTRKGIPNGKRAQYWKLILQLEDIRKSAEVSYEVKFSFFT